MFARTAIIARVISSSETSGPMPELAPRLNVFSCRVSSSSLFSGESGSPSKITVSRPDPGARLNQ